ncbi:cysteine desulfurase-like protein, partial [Singulisphaera rosea]
VDVCRSLAREGVFASHGDFYATIVVERLGLAQQGLVRIGGACYTTPEESERVIAGVRGVVGRGS